MDLRQLQMNTELGELWLVATAEGLQEVRWTPRSDVAELKTKDITLAAQWLRQATLELSEYLAGERTRFEVPLCPEGTPFQQKVWRQLRRIPYGKTVSYRAIAERLGQPGASRAVGTANGRNPLTIIVPCHRVIAADGTLGGYSGGLPKKSKLLALEASGP